MTRPSPAAATFPYPHRTVAQTTRACTDCGGPVSRTSASGRCRECCYSEGAYKGGARNTGVGSGIEVFDPASLSAAQSSAALLRALVAYAEKYQPNVAWLREAA